MLATSSGVTEALQRDICEQRGEFCGVVQQIFIDRGFDGAGRDGVYGDA